MNLDNLYPCAHTHAIQAAVFAVEWLNPLTPDQIEMVRKLGTKFKHAGLAFIHQQTLLEFKLNQANMTPDGVATPNTITNGAAGIVFSRSNDPNALVRTVTITRNHCLVAVPDYTGWESVLTDVKTYLEIALDFLAQHRGLSAVGLQYNNSFSWKDDPDSLDLRAVFAQDAMLPPNIFSNKGLWHAHQGNLQTHDSPLPHALLGNMNIDMIDQAGERTLNVVSAQRAGLNQALWQANKKHQPQLYELFSRLHDANKDALRQLFTPELGARIHLQGG